MDVVHSLSHLLIWNAAIPPVRSGSASTQVISDMEFCSTLAQPIQKEHSGAWSRLGAKSKGICATR